MILMKVKKIDKIKIIHRKYFDKIVEKKIEEVMKDKNLEVSTANFLKEFFYIDAKINTKLLDDICYGDQKKLMQIIEVYEQTTQKYFYKNTLKKCINIIDNYSYYIKNDGYGKEDIRFDAWINVIKDIKDILEKKEYDVVLAKIKKTLEEEANKIKNYKIGTVNNIDSYEFKFSNKNDIQKYIKNLSDEFIIDNKLQIKLKEIFNYEKFRDNKTEIIYDKYIWNRHMLITMMGINVCPYCNRQFISSYVDKNIIKTTGDLDHFYNQDRYPFLALSLYNFIPSCQICNSRFKIADNFYLKPHIYPYTEEFGRAAKFVTSFYTDKDTRRKENMDDLKEADRYDISYLLGNSDNFKIEIEPEHSKSDIKDKIENSIKTFRIEELYNFHKDYVREVIKKAIIYNESRIDELYTQYPELFSSREEVLQTVVSNYICIDDLGKRPLAKLTRDIAEELGILKYT